MATEKTDVVIEEGAVALAAGMRVGCGLARFGGRRLVPVVLLFLGDRRRQEVRARDGARACGRPLEKCAACFVMLAHASFLPVDF